ncbi:MAG: YhjD/YihY/BrkB family envelope integrity protein, partial [Sphingorhabdus sp.]
MSEHSPLSPEARAHKPVAEVSAESEASWFSHLGVPYKVFEVLKRVTTGVYSEGFVHAGNFAYLSLVALFSFCIVAAAIAGGLGQTQSGIALIEAFFQTVPPGVAEALRGPVENAMTTRSGPLLWFGAIVSLWTTASLIET